MISSPFALFDQFAFTPLDHVYMVSDSMYANYQKAEALKHIQSLERRASEYRQLLNSFTSTIAELKKEQGLLEPANADYK